MIVVTLLESEALGLRHEYPGKHSTESTSRAPNKEHFNAEIALVFVDDERNDNADNTVPEPIRGC